MNRESIKKAFRLAINRSKSRGEARRIDRLRGKYFMGTLTQTEAILGWLDLKLESKDYGNSRVSAP